jgi:lysozyme family protein
MELTRTKRLEYIQLWLSLSQALDEPMATHYRSSANDFIRLVKHEGIQGRYESVSRRLLPLVCPWELVAVIHWMESTGDFTTHLHNGDPLYQDGRPVATVNVPRGRGPFPSWEDSAVDALTMKLKGNVLDLSKMRVEEWLFFLEAYNGFGYRSKGINSPYLWSGTRHYIKGKYTADGKYDANTISYQVGAAVLLSRLMCLDSPVPPPLITRTLSGDDAKRLQQFLEDTRLGLGESIPFVKQDGKIGPKTMAAFKDVFGFEIY